jgi:hypothetical protein
MLPPKPERPEFTARPGGSWLSIALVAGFGILMAAVVSILTMGYFLWIVLLALAIFGTIAVQYLVWGYWFERIYRSNLPPDDDFPHDIHS